MTIPYLKMHEEYHNYLKEKAYIEAEKDYQMKLEFKEIFELKPVEIIVKKPNVKLKTKV